MDLPHGLVAVASFVLSFVIVLAIWAASGHFSVAFHGSVDWPVRTGTNDGPALAPTWLLYVVFPSAVLWVAFMARYEQVWINEHAPKRNAEQEKAPPRD